MTGVNVVVEGGMNADGYSGVYRDRGQHPEWNLNKRITINSGFVIDQGLLGIRVFSELPVIDERIGSRGRMSDPCTADLRSMGGEIGSIRIGK